MNLISVNKNDIAVGKPLLRTLYDANHAVLLARGDIIADDVQRDELLAQGAAYELYADKSGSAGEHADFVKSMRENEDKTRFSFDDMRLKVEDRLQFQPPVQMARERFVVRVIGYLRGCSLLVTTPVMNGGIRLKLLEGENVVMRSFTGQNAYGFACTVEHVCKLPYEYLHLSFPDNIEGVVVRKAPRVRTHITAGVRNLSTPDQNQSQQAFISNISANGAALDARQALGGEGDIVSMAFRVSVHNIEVFLSFEGVIHTVSSCCATEKEEIEIVRHGVEFRCLELNDSVILKSMIYQQIIESPHLQM